ncbi:MAG: ISNCY family transposase [Synergistales bacterium]|nr:ISNCY family transposase [Synergistales bacterium]
MKTGGDIFLNARESRKVYVMEQVLKGVMTASCAAVSLNLSKRQIFRLKGTMKTQGLSALVHGNRERKPAHTIPDNLRNLIELKAKGDYKGTSCAHMAELLQEHDGISISSKSVIRILKNADMPLRHKHKSPAKHRSRPRKDLFGQMVQVDASPYDWLSDGRMLSLHGAIDDATSRVLGLWLCEHECGMGYFKVLEQIIDLWGVPSSLLSDRHTIFVSPNSGRLSVQEELIGMSEPLSQFGHSLSLLGVTHSQARSPQSKGRMERLWGTLQPRLPVEFALNKCLSMEQANLFLAASFIKKHNDRFAVDPASSDSAFSPAPDHNTLELILAWRHERKASSGSVISFEGQRFQLASASGNIVSLRPKEPITVVRTLSGALKAIHNNKAFDLLPAPERTAQKPTSKNGEAIAAVPGKSSIPASNHPWRQYPNPIRIQETENNKILNKIKVVSCK